MDAVNRLNGRVSMVTFRLDQRVFALPVEPIRQIIEMVTITPIPQVNGAVEGVINFHGALVPVINLCAYLSLPKKALHLYTPIILVSIFDRLTGLIVDEVLDVLDQPDSQVIHPKDILPEGLGEAPVLRGMVQAQDRMVMLLDLDQLFHPQQARLWMEAARALSMPMEAVIPDPEPPQPPPEKHKRKKPVSDKKEVQPEPAAEANLVVTAKNQAEAKE